MEIINNLFLILVLLSCVAFVVGMIKPSFLKMASRKKVIIWTLSSLFVSVVLFGLTQTEEQKQQIEKDKLAREKIELAEKEQREQQALQKLQAEEKAKQIAKLEAQAEVDSKSIKDLGLTVEQFRESFNAKVEQLEETGKEWDVKKLKSFSIVNRDGKKIFVQKISNDLEIGGDISPNGNISNVGFLLQPKLENSDQLVRNLNLYATVTAHTLAFDGADKKDLHNIIAEVITEFGSNKESVMRESTDLSFLMLNEDNKSLWFIISRKN